jgi:4'-phosphopantetheinyl transferase
LPAPVVRPLEQIDALADCCLTTAERQELREQPEARRSEAFLRLWTRREAYLKATGIGISGLDPDVVATTDAARGWTGAPAYDWCVEQFVPAKGYVAALVVKGWAPR